MNRSLLPHLICLLLAGSGCASSNLERLNRSTSYGGTPKLNAHLSEVPVTGFEVTVKLKDHRIKGELLAVDAECIWVLRKKTLQDTGRPADDARGSPLPWRRLSPEPDPVTQAGEKLPSPPLSPLERLQKSEIENVTVQLYDPKTGIATAWMVLGAISTISHGYFILLSLPTWLVSGGIANAAGSSESRLVVWPEHFAQLHEFARYPQGLAPEYLLQLVSP